jgi:hypothetical protein
VLNAAGYAVGSLVSGEEIDCTEAGLAFVADAVTPGGTGTGVKKLLTGIGWGMVSNGGQSGLSQGIDLITGQRKKFSVSELAVDTLVGGVGTGLGDFAAEPVESYAQNTLRGFGRGASGALQIAIDTAFAWAKSNFD